MVPCFGVALDAEGNWSSLVLVFGLVTRRPRAGERKGQTVEDIHFGGYREARCRKASGSRSSWSDSAERQRGYRKVALGGRASKGAEVVLKSREFERVRVGLGRIPEPQGEGTRLDDFWKSSHLGWKKEMGVHTRSNRREVIAASLSE
jgi:hypothetical protein